MKVLITGASGQLGTKLTEMLSQHHIIIPTDVAEMDITNPDSVRSVIGREQPEMVIHAAAYTNVDRAETEEGGALCQKINANGTSNVAMVCAEIGAGMVNISTDFVFDGKKKFPYLETDEPNPLNVYGQTKFEGEKIVAGLVRDHYIIRTAWLYGESDPQNPRPNFVQTMIRLAYERPELKVIDDQIGSPTYTKDLVGAIDQIIEKKPVPGIYHFSGQGECSWYDFAKETFRIKSIQIDLKPIPSAEYAQAARRPRYSYLSKERIEAALGIEVRTWQEMLGDYLEDKKE